MNKDLLMSFEAYTKIPHVEPYIYTLSKGDQCLYYFGSRHTFDPGDSQLEKLRNFFKEFLQRTKASKRIALIEGGDRPVPENEKNSILEQGEMGFVVYLTNQANIDWFSPEPPPVVRHKALFEKFSREEIACFDFVLAVWQWNKMEEKPEFETYIHRHLVGDKQGSEWASFDFLIEHMVVLFEKLLGIPFNKNNQELLNQLIDPTRVEGNIFNKISAFEDSGFRDRYILSKIERFWNQGLSIFIIYGATHAVMQEPALHSLIDF